LVVLLVAIWCRRNTSKVRLHHLHRAAWEGTLEEAAQSEIGDVLVGEHRQFHGVRDAKFRHLKDEVEELLLLCQVDRKLPRRNGK
jgi:hypothetical protein